LQKGVKQTGVVGTAATGIGTAACLAESWEKVVIQMQLRLVGCLVTFAYRPIIRQENVPAKIRAALREDVLTARAPSFPGARAFTSSTVGCLHLSA